MDFIKSFVEIIKGENAEVKAKKNKKKAISALKTQIASLEGDTISKEDKVEDANEALKSAFINNGKDIEDRNQYVKQLVEAKNALIEAEEDLESHKETLQFLEESYKSITSK